MINFKRIEQQRNNEASSEGWDHRSQPRIVHREARLQRGTQSELWRLWKTSSRMEAGCLCILHGKYLSMWNSSSHYYKSNWTSKYLIWAHPTSPNHLLRQVSKDQNHCPWPRQQENAWVGISRWLQQGGVQAVSDVWKAASWSWPALPSGLLLQAEGKCNSF